MKMKTWLIPEAAQSRKCCWSIASSLITLNTYFAARIRGWGEPSHTLLLIRSRQWAPSRPTATNTCAERGKRAKKWCLLSVTPLNRSHLPSWIFPPSFSSLFACTCSHVSHFAVPVPSVTLSWLLQQPPWGHSSNFHAFDCGVCLTEDPPWLRHQPGAS